MAGLLTHLGAGFLGFLIIWFAFYKSEKKTKLIYGGLFVLANIIPDLIDFGIAGIKQGSLNPSVIMTNPLFRPLAILGHTFSNWLILMGIVVVILFVLYKFEKISKKVFVKTIIAIVLILVGVAIHLGLDKLIIETSYWI